MSIYKTLLISFLFVRGVVATPPMPATPAAVKDLVAAQPFKLAQAEVHTWHKDKPSFSEGYLLVIEVEPAYVYPRATGMPVLYVGSQTARVLNNGVNSGHIVALVPGPIDLTKAPIWFGAPYLPGEVTDERISTERKAAADAGIVPFSEEKLRAALDRGGEGADVANIGILSDRVADLIARYAPDESRLADIHRKRAEAARARSR